MPNTRKIYVNKAKVEKESPDPSLPQSSKQTNKQGAKSTHNRNFPRLSTNSRTKSTIGKDSSRDDIEKLNSLKQQSESEIFEVSSVFPFQLFPDRIRVDKTKVTVVRKHLFQIHLFPILIEDILTVKINRGLFFASIAFEVRGFEQNPGDITHLRPAEAQKAEKYILGLLKAKKNDIDLEDVATKILKKKIKEVGKTGVDISDII